jgi:polysaccharide biosynthesis transport protein
MPVVMADRDNGHRGGTPAHALRQVTPPAAVVSEGLVKIAWRGRWIMFVCLVLALAIGFVYIQAVAPIYTSTAKVYLDYSSLPRLGSNETGRIPRTERYLSTQADVLASWDILAKGLSASGMQQLRTFSNTDDRVGYVRRKIRVSVGRRDDVISVSFDSRYAAEAAQIVNAVVESYLEDRSDKTENSASQVYEMLRVNMNELDAELETKTKQLEDFRAHQMPLSLGSPEVGSGVSQTALEYESEMARLTIETDKAMEFLVRVEELAADPGALRIYLATRGLISLYDVGTTSERGPLRAELTRTQEQYDRLLAELTPDHPNIIALEAAIERANAKLRDVDDRFVKAVLTAAQQQRAEMNKLRNDAAERCREQNEKVKSYYKELSAFQARHSEIQSLEIRAQNDRANMRELATYVTGGEAAAQMKMRSLENALPAQEPSSPQKGRVMAIALFLGLSSGGGLSILRDLLDQKLRSADEISALLGLPVLGVVPTMSRRIKISARGQHVHVQPDSPEAEAFRTVRTAIFFGTPKEKAKTILVTSPAQGDGKSTLASNLAIAMAQAGQKTILVDADFRRPVQHTIFETELDESGLSAVVAGTAKLAQTIQPTQVKGLELIPCGPKVPNPAEILNSPRFKKLLERLAEVYDRVIIDAPPVTVVTDAQIIGAICGITILVLRADKSTKKNGERAIDALHRVGANLLGAVVNDVRRSGDRYGYCGQGGGYGNASGSGRNGKRAAKDRDAERGKSRLQSAMGLAVKGGSFNDRNALSVRSRISESEASKGTEV